MRIGLIARDEIARGLAIQSKGFFDNIPVERVLLVEMPRADCARAPEWYPGAWKIAYDPILHQLNKTMVCDWMSGLDVVFTVETPYDWRLPDWARLMGVKTVIQGNPEFYRHNLPGYTHQAHPDAWWWPTRWRLDDLPAGTVVPVPMPDVERTAAGLRDPFTVLHVMGKRAFQDRNGTDIFCSALQNTRGRIHARIHGIDEELPLFRDATNMTVERFPSAVADRWSMYAGSHLLVVPRKYGGLCLPALEAAACGLGVIMSDCEPNAELAQDLVAARTVRPINLACGTVMISEVGQVDLAQRIDAYAADSDRVHRLQDEAFTTVPRWSAYRDVYLAELEKVVAG